MYPMWFDDDASAVIVLGGTAIATVLRCGFGDCAQTLRRLAAAAGPRFAAAQVRGQLAVQLQAIQKQGLYRAEPQHLGDTAFDAATDALIGQQSVAALCATHAAHQAMRQAATLVAVATLGQAAELAPVFGLAGTLVSLGRLPADGLDRGSYMAAIAMAVHATLYGLIAANLVLAPLAQWVERVGRREEAERQRLVDWLAQSLAQSLAQTLPHAPVPIADPPPAAARIQRRSR